MITYYRGTTTKQNQTLPVPDASLDSSAADQDWMDLDTSLLGRITVAWELSVFSLGQNQLPGQLVDSCDEAKRSIERALKADDGGTMMGGLATYAWYSKVSNDVEVGIGSSTGTCLIPIGSESG